MQSPETLPLAREGVAFIQFKDIQTANSREAPGIIQRNLQVSPKAHLVPALAASSLPQVEVRTWAGLWGMPAATMGNTRSTEKEKKWQKLQLGFPQSKPQEKPGKQGTYFPPKYEAGTHSCGATGGAHAEGTLPRSADSSLKCLWLSERQH